MSSPTTAEALAQPRTSGRLVVRTSAGLGNRLSALLSALVIADLLRTQLTFVWPTADSDCYGNFAALFEPITLPHVTFQDETPDMKWTDSRNFSGAGIRQAVERGETLHLAAYTIFGYDLKPGWEFFEACRAHLRLLRPIAEIRALVETAASARIGVHVRLGDHFPCYWLTPRWCYRATLDTLTRRFPTESFYVCSDTKEIVDEFEALYPGRIIASPTRSLASLKLRGTLEGSRAAVTDLWILAHRAVVISTPLSSFAVTAQNLGGGLAFFIATMAEPAKYRRIQLAWKTHSFLKRDLNQDRWTVSPQRKGRVERSLGFFVVLFANLISSKWFQDRPNTATRRRFVERLKRFLNSPECVKALEKNSGH